MRVLFTEHDDRVPAAIAQLAKDGIAASIVGAVPDRARIAAALAARRGVAPWLSDKLLDRPVYAALALLADGDADLVVAGVTSHTADVLVACELCLGPAAPDGIAAGAFRMDVPGRKPLVFADCAVHPAPTAEELAAIAVAAADGAARLLDEPPRVALLSFSTHGSAQHERVTKVADATLIARNLRPAVSIDGELQADAALDAAVATHKGADGTVAGRANVLVFPDLDAANIAYKLVRSLARAPAYGAFLYGFARPVVKLSRGATVEEIAGTVRLAARAAR